MTRILVVGPQREIDAGFLDELTDAGLSVERISDAPSAVSAIDRVRPDVIVSSASLPEWSGTRLLRHVESNYPDIATFLLVEGDLEELAAAQRSDITPLYVDGTDQADLVDIIQDRVFEGQVGANRDLHRHLSVATAEILLEAMEALNRSSNYRHSPDLLHETAIASARDVVEQTVCSKLIGVPEYALVWVSHFFADSEDLEPQAAAGMDVQQLRDRHVSEFADVGDVLRNGELGVRLGENYVEALVPLRNGDSIFGAIHVQKHGRGFSSFEQDQLERLGNTVGRFVAALERRHEIAGQATAVDEAEPETDESEGGAEAETDSETVESTDEDLPDTFETGAGLEVLADEELDTDESETDEAESADEAEEEPTSDTEDTEPEDGTAGTEPSGDATDAESASQSAAVESEEAVEETDTETGPEDRADEDTMSPLVAYSDTIAHELRNHVNVAQAFLDLGRDRDDEENFDRVESALERINRLTDEAAAVARGAVEPSQMGTRDLAEDARVAWERVEADEAELVVEENLQVVADHDLLVLLLENLFRNAVDHVGDDVNLQVGTLDGDQTGFYVEDDGPGIPEPERERLFGWGVSGGDSDGGIGLAIVKQIVENHGWTISIADGSDGGARFEVSDVEVSD